MFSNIGLTLNFLLPPHRSPFIILRVFAVDLAVGGTLERTSGLRSYAYELPRYLLSLFTAPLRCSYG